MKLLLLLPLVIIASLPSDNHATTTAVSGTTPTSQEDETMPSSMAPTVAVTTLVAQIGAPVLTILGVAATTTVACFAHFKKKRKISRRVREARQRALERGKAQDNGSTVQDSNNSVQDNNTRVQASNTIQGNTGVQDTTNLNATI